MILIQPSPSRLSVSRRNYLLSYIYNFAFWRRRETRTTVTTKNYMPCPWPVAVRRDDTRYRRTDGTPCLIVSYRVRRGLHKFPLRTMPRSWLNSVNSAHGIGQSERCDRTSVVTQTRDTPIYQSERPKTQTTAAPGISEHVEETPSGLARACEARRLTRANSQLVRTAYDGNGAYHITC